MTWCRADRVADFFGVPGKRVFSTVRQIKNKKAILKKSVGAWAGGSHPTHWLHTELYTCHNGNENSYRPVKTGRKSFNAKIVNTRVEFSGYISASTEPFLWTLASIAPGKSAHKIHEAASIVQYTRPTPTRLNWRVESRRIDGVNRICN